MAHDTHQHHSTENKPKTALNSSFWFVLILAGLFIAAVNFINVMSHDDEGHGNGHDTHETHTPAGHEAATGAEHEAPAAGHDSAAGEHGGDNGHAAPAETAPAHEAGH